MVQKFPEKLSFVILFCSFLFFVKSCGGGVWDSTTITRGLGLGSAHSCAVGTVSKARALKCWGLNSSGQLGLGDNLSRGDNISDLGNSLSSVALSSGVSPVLVRGGGAHTCFLGSSLSSLGKPYLLKCWGLNSSGQLGLGDNLSRGDNETELVDNLSTVELGDGLYAATVALGSVHSCALLDNESAQTYRVGIKCWGNNAYGQLGLGDNSSRGDNQTSMGDNLSFVDLGTDMKASAVFLGNNHSCAVLGEASSSLANSYVKCWGNNDYGQLGLGNSHAKGDEPGELGDALLPIDLLSGYSIRELAVGGNHNCVSLDKIGTVLTVEALIKCWGLNDDGQLGLGDTKKRGYDNSEMGTNLPILNLGSGF